VSGALGWADVCAQPPELRVIGGSHRTIVLEPHVEQLAEGLIAALSNPLATDTSKGCP
jgi:thioesterase domain-containing protein